MSEAVSTVVVIEDELQIRRFVRAALEDEGCRVYDAESAAQGLAETGERKPDLVILDLGLPDREGIEVIRDLRSWSTVPVIILSARAEEEDKIEALDAGADDYLTKPFGVGELLARTRALLRRSRTGTPEPLVEFGDVRIDLSRRTVHRGGEAVHLTPTEYRLLATLLAKPGRVLTHRQLLKDVWGPDSVQSNHYLRIYVANLRRKLETDPAQPKYLLTETGIGYRFQNQP
jgi:two-component system, OmpR family, KDP operon response regulator KdpE